MLELNPQRLPKFAVCGQRHGLTITLKRKAQRVAARQIGTKLGGLQTQIDGVTYVSMIGPLCHDGACLAYLDGDRKEKLMTYDYAHFTLPASEFVVRTVVYPAMSGLLN